MNVLYPRCAGLDVHKKTVVACRIVPGPDGQPHKEIATFGTTTHELLRLAIPRRVYTQSHIDYVVEAILEVNARKQQIRGMEITEEPPFLRHFSARFRQL